MKSGDSEIKMVPISNIHHEEGIEEMLKSPTLEPYYAVYGAEMRGEDPAPYLDSLRQVPLHERYIWRIVSAPKWAFGDWDSETLRLDLTTMSDDDKKKVLAMLCFRPAQFVGFLHAIYGKHAADAMLQSSMGISGNEDEQPGEPPPRPTTPKYPPLAPPITDQEWEQMLARERQAIIRAHEKDLEEESKLPPNIKEALATLRRIRGK